ncbi:MAG: hypothetical protein LBD60_03510 [Puniceicoccales bacterium]|nr:hypothetical protein [Puniceicoccales bacterium]
MEPICYRGLIRNGAGIDDSNIDRWIHDVRISQPAELEGFDERTRFGGI